MRTAAALLVAALSALPAAADTLEGTVTVLAPIAVPPGTLLEVALVARAAPDRPLARHRTPEAGAPPYPFGLSVPDGTGPDGAGPDGAGPDGAGPDGAGQAGSLAVSATLRLPDGRLAAAGAAALPQGGPAEVILLHGAAPVADAPLAGPLWRLAFLGGAGVGSLDGERDIPYLLFGDDSRAAGSGGCNRLVAGYRTGRAGGLRIERPASTMMACTEAVLARELAFAEALSRTTAHAIAGDVLTLSAGADPLAVLVAEGAP